MIETKPSLTEPHLGWAVFWQIIHEAALRIPDEDDQAGGQPVPEPEDED